ncbi:MAG: UDP-N-acetylmuramoyl-L-alanine--D-glutamate ligase [Porticoccaceae bacterium]
MSQLIATTARCAIVGMGQTGLSLARYCLAKEISFDLFDSRSEPPMAKEMAAEFPAARQFTGPFDSAKLSTYGRLLVSPGVSRNTPALLEAQAAGVELSGDAQLFFDAASAPVIAITGSNGKSTVTTLVGEMAMASGRKVAVGGNLGTPMLALLDDSIDLYVVELSSFQLELLDDCRGAIVALLNISADHMDRYVDINSYRLAKQRIYRGASVALSNRADPLTSGLYANSVKPLRFGLNKPDLRDWGVAEEQGEPTIFFGMQPIVAIHQLPLRGSHNVANAVAALALGEAAGLEREPMLQALKSFKGLAHRCELVAERNGVVYINDSKATNVGAAIAAVEGLTPEGRARIILLAGGDAKGQDFANLALCAKSRVKSVVLFGRDAGLLAEAFAQSLPSDSIVMVGELAEAFAAAVAMAQTDDIVLLAPACASFDQYPSFEARGDEFVALVKGGAVC